MYVSMYVYAFKNNTVNDIQMTIPDYSVAAVSVMPSVVPSGAEMLIIYLVSQA